MLTTWYSVAFPVVLVYDSSRAVVTVVLVTLNFRS